VFAVRPASCRTNAWPKCRSCPPCEYGAHVICHAGVWRFDIDEETGARHLLRSGIAGRLVLWNQGLQSFDLVVQPRVRCGLFVHFVGPMQPVLASARRMLLRQETANLSELENLAMHINGDTLLAESYIQSEAKAFATLSTPIGREDLVRAMGFLTREAGIQGFTKVIFAADLTALEHDRRRSHSRRSIRTCASWLTRWIAIATSYGWWLGRTSLARSAPRSCAGSMGTRLTWSNRSINCWNELPAGMVHHQMLPHDCAFNGPHGRKRRHRQRPARSAPGNGSIWVWPVSSRRRGCGCCGSSDATCSSLARIPANRTGAGTI
jgi:hypothetical protein